MKRVYVAVALCCLVAGTARAAGDESFLERLRGYLGLRAASIRVAPDGSTRGATTASLPGRTANSTGSGVPQGDAPTCTCSVTSPERGGDQITDPSGCRLAPGPAAKPLIY